MNSSRSAVSGCRNRPAVVAALPVLAFLLLMSSRALAVPPPSPLAVHAVDHRWDTGTQIDVLVTLPDVPEDAEYQYVVQRSGEYRGLYEDVARVTPTPRQRQEGVLKVVIDKCVRGEPYWFRVATLGTNGEMSPFLGLSEQAPAIARRQLFDGSRFWLAVITLLICGAVVTFVVLARFGMPLKIRPIAGLEAVEEAVGRATEMGRSCLFVPGIQDMNEMQTIAGLTILSRVAQRAAEYDCRLETPTSRSLVMTAARETVESAFLAAGRPDAYNADDIYYVTDEQFAYVSFLTGKMVREKPAACFYLGSFFAESLILAETGNAIGAIQVAGTAQPAQLPFFVAACDYTLIGEEFFAASAYLSKNPDQLGSLKGQDVGKLIVAALILVGVGLTTLVQIIPSPVLRGQLADAAHYLTEVILHAGG